VQTERKTSEESHELCLRSAASTYLIFGAIIVPVILFWVYLALTRTPSGWQAVGILGVVLGIWVVYFASLRLTVSQGAIRYRTLLNRRSLSLADIARSELSWNFAGRDPRPFLVITPANGEQALRVNLKPFRREDIRQLLALPELRLEKHDHVA
jgi:hypothetical protein